MCISKTSKCKIISGSVAAAAEKGERQVTKGMLVVTKLSLMQYKLHFFKESISLGLISKRWVKNKCNKEHEEFF